MLELMPAEFKFDSKEVERSEPRTWFDAPRPNVERVVQ